MRSTTPEAGAQREAGRTGVGRIGDRVTAGATGRTSAAFSLGGRKL